MKNIFKLDLWSLCPWPVYSWPLWHRRQHPHTHRLFQLDEHICIKSAQKTLLFVRESRVNLSCTISSYLAGSLLQVLVLWLCGPSTVRAVGLRNQHQVESKVHIHTHLTVAFSVHSHMSDMDQGKFNRDNRWFLISKFDLAFYCQRRIMRWLERPVLPGLFGSATLVVVQVEIDSVRMDAVYCFLLTFCQSLFNVYFM